MYSVRYIFDFINWYTRTRESYRVIETSELKNKTLDQIKLMHFTH